MPGVEPGVLFFLSRATLRGTTREFFGHMKRFNIEAESFDEPERPESAIVIIVILLLLNAFGVVVWLRDLAGL